MPGRDFYFVVDRWRSPWDWATRTGRTSTSASASLAFEARASSPRNQVTTNNKIYRCTYIKNMIHGTTVSMCDAVSVSVDFILYGSVEIITRQSEPRFNFL